MGCSASKGRLIISTLNNPNSNNNNIQVNLAANREPQILLSGSPSTKSATKSTAPIPHPISQVKKILKEETKEERAAFSSKAISKAISRPVNQANKALKEETKQLNSTIKSTGIPQAIHSAQKLTQEESRHSKPVKQTTELSYEEVAKQQPTSIGEMWSLVKGTSEKQSIHIEPTKNRKGWRTIRIFVSSTFKDFHAEREVLVKEVFPDLRLWCEQRKLRLVECDLRWGVPKDSSTEETIQICLGELDRCYEDNTAPFFLNLAGQRAGWVPYFGDLTMNLAAQYGWVYGLSVTEMEIVHGAFRKLNPNALFMMREPFPIEKIPEERHNDFLDKDSLSLEKLQELKSMIHGTFEGSNVFQYNITPYQSVDDKLCFDGLGGSESDFSHKVYDFFKNKIETLYPLDPSPEDPLQVQKEAHEMFLDSRSQCVLGRDSILEKVDSYIIGDGSNKPLLLIGTAGAGKSAIAAKSATTAINLINKNKIPVPSGFDQWKVFFHFVGATPGSTDLAFFLQRLTKELNPHAKDILSDLDALVNMSYGLLSNPNTQPVIIFVDAVNQIDDDKQRYLNQWLPDSLSPNVRIVVSTIEGTESHRVLRAFGSSPTEIVCGPLDETSRKAIVENILGQYNKRLDDDQMACLLDKKGSSNPLWLTLACEELRIFGDFKMLLQKIVSLPDGLISLEEDVFARFENESGSGELMVATLCLLENSRHGLLETELLALLGEESNRKPQPFDENQTQELIEHQQNKKNESFILEEEEKEGVDQITEDLAQLVNDAYIVKEENNEKIKRTSARQKGKQITFLPAREWAVIYRNLKQLLRPCGDLGEGRLDFYHRSLSKAVRKRYFSGTDEYKTHMYNFWHGVLAGYFEETDDMDRKAEELPYHLEQLMDNNRLICCLLEWPVFHRLFSDDFSISLLHSWQKAGGYPVASAMYKASLKALRKSGIDLARYGDVQEDVASFLIQAGQYEDAMEILTERKEIEEDLLGRRPFEFAQIYELMGKCKSEVCKNYSYVDQSKMGEDLEVVEYCRKSLEYRKDITGEDNEYRCGLLNILICHHLGDFISNPEYKNEATMAINKAITIFTKLNDIGHIADATMTKSFVNPREPQYFEENLKLLKRAHELCVKVYGDSHVLATRILLNTGILYEDNGRYEEAYDYYLKWNETCIKVLGSTHPKTVRSYKTLKEPVYIQIKKRRERATAFSA